MKISDITRGSTGADLDGGVAPISDEVRPVILSVIALSG